MNNLETNAINLLRSGFNCAQAVLVSYNEKLNFDQKLALSIACGFGGGMGRLQETCGVVTGAFMVLGIYNSAKYTDNKDRKAKTYKMVRDFNENFLALHHSTKCKSLLNCDLNTPEGQQYMKEHNLHETVCEKCVSSSIKILEELMN
jgi:C_GCAxxG_C_C family probable redox protein